DWSSDVCSSDLGEARDRSALRSLRGARSARSAGGTPHGRLHDSARGSGVKARSGVRAGSAADPHYAPCMQRRMVLIAAGGMLLGAGCGGPSPGAEDTRERDLRNAHQRVEGTWLLVGFEPEKPLGAPFDALVRDQIGKLE